MSLRLPGMNYAKFRFTHVCCTSMKRGSAVVKVWIVKSVIVAGLRSVQRIIIKHVLVAARDELCKVLDLHTFAAHL